MTDTERLDAIIKEVRTKLGFGWWWGVMHLIHKEAMYGGVDARAVIDAALSPPPSEDSP